MVNRPDQVGIASSLSDLLALGADPKLLQHHLFSVQVERAATTDPELARMLRACAIPRRFDAQIIGILRDMPGDKETNDRLLASLLSYSFVLSRKDGDYVYHDNTRDLLLDEWLTDPARQEEFAQFSRRLVAFYEGLYEETQKSEKELAELARVLLAANPARYVQLATLIEKQVVPPLLEALYHESLHSAEAGYAFFMRYFETFEQNNRLNVCELLLNTARDTFLRLPPDHGQEPYLKWLRYWEGRLSLSRAHYPQAESRLSDLRLDSKDNTKLQMWLLGDLGRSLQYQFRLGEALEVYKENLEIRSENLEIDIYNLPIAYNQLANLYWSVGDLKQAATLIREGIDKTQEQPDARRDMLVYLRLDLSSVLFELGHWTEAYDMTIEALQISRGKLYYNQAVQRAVANHLMKLFARRDARLFDTLFVEFDVLQVSMRNSPEEILTYKVYVELLQASGRVSQAEKKMKELLQRAVDYAESPTGTELLYLEASYQWDRGHFEEASDLYTKILQRFQEDRATIWDYAAALANRGMINGDKRSAFESAKNDLEEACKKWKELGYEQFSVLTRIGLANSARRQGNMPRAQKILDEVRLLVSGMAPEYQADHCRVQAHVYEDQALYAQAWEQYNQALALNLSIDRLQAATNNLSQMANVASAQGEWDKAKRCAQEASLLWKQLAEREHYSPKAKVRQADEYNAKGLRLLCQDEGDSMLTLDAARHQFQVAIELVPANFWYQLNLTWVHARLEEWAKAAQTLETALRKAPEWLRSPILYQQVADYLLKQGDIQFKSQEPTLAQVAYENGLESAQTIEAETDTFYVLMAELHSRLGYIHLDLAAHKNAYAHFNHALQFYGKGHKFNGGGAIGDTYRVLLEYDTTTDAAGRLAHYWRLNCEWHELANQPNIDEEIRQQILAAQQAFGKYLDILYELTAPADTLEGFIPMATPIVMEFADNVIPKVDPRQDNGKFLHEDIAAMRDRILADLGVKVPGVKARGNTSLSDGGYVVMLDEIAIASGEVQLNMGYCPVTREILQSIGSLSEDCIQAPHPRTGEMGYWLPQDVWSAAEDNGLEVWPEMHFIIHHLETILRRNLVNFVGIQETETLLQEWGSTENGAALIQSALPDQTTRAPFVFLLRALVQEQVPLTSGEAILAAVQGDILANHDFAAILRAVRLRLKEKLPINIRQVRRLPLPSEWEEKLAVESDSALWHLSPWETYQFSAELHKWLQPLSGDAVLTTRDGRLRLSLRRLIEAEFPDLMVFAEEELLDPGAGVAPADPNPKLFADIS
jgi:hypothetical protein